MDRDDVWNKARSLMTRLGGKRIEKVIASVWNLEQLGNVKSLVNLVAS
jgi:hypothetical protein